MTNRELVDAAWAEIVTSTISGSEWQKRVTFGYKGKPYNWQNTAYGRAKLLLDQVDTTTPPPSGGPTLTHPYAANSWVNTPITNPQYSPDNTAQMAECVANWVPSFGPTMNSTPSVYASTASTPLVTVHVNYPSCNTAQYSVPIEPTWKTGNGGIYMVEAEPGMIVRNGTNGDEWSMFKLTPPNVATLNSSGGPAAGACTGNYWSCNRLEVSRGADGGGWYGSGIGPSPRGSGVLFGPGLIMAEETKMPAGSDWGHALVMAYWRTRSGSYVYPARYSDGAWSGAYSIPMGAKFWLPPGWDIEASGMYEWQKQMCRTIRKYGLYIVDSGQAIGCEGVASARSRGGATFAWENEGQGNWNYLPKAAVEQFVVLY